MKLSHIPKIKMAATMYNLLHYCSLPRCIITLNTERDCYAICYYFESHLHTFWVSWYIFRLSECGTLETISFGIDVKNEWQRLLLETAAGPGCLHFTWL